MSGISPESHAHVVIDITGVIPDPAEMNRYFFAGCRRKVNCPAGPWALIHIPGFRWSSSQRVPTDPACAFTVIEVDRGREGLDEMV